MENLSHNILKSIIKEDSLGEQFTVQIIGLKLLHKKNYDIYRLSISDGKFWYSKVVLSEILNAMVDNEELSVLSIIKVKDYEIVLESMKKDHKVLIIRELDVLELGTKSSFQIGFPLDVFSTENEVLKNPITKIKDLHIMPNFWKIQCKVIAKYPIKYWSNEKSVGKLFNIDVIDDTGQIRVIGFRNLVDKFYSLFEVDSNYEISKSSVRFANKDYPTKNDYEIVLTDNSIVEKSEINIENLPNLQDEFKQISTILDCDKNELVNVIALCQIGDLVKFVAKSNGTEYRKRDINLSDTSGNIQLTLWNEDAEDIFDDDVRVLMIKNARLNEFNENKYLSKTALTVISKNPVIEEANCLYDLLEEE